MQFLNNNGFRTAVIVFIIFLAIPFLFTDKQPTALTPQQEASGGLPVGMTKNPLAKFFNRVASFYGLKKKAGQGLDALNSYADAGSAAQNLGSLGDDSPVTIEEGSASGAPKGFVATEGAATSAAAGEVVQEYVRMDGKTYEVVKDPSGKKYVLTDNGPVSFDDLMASTVSKEEFEAAKKIAPSLSDDEIPYAIRSPYGVKGYLDRKTRGLLTYEDNPSLFGGPDGNLRGQRGSNLFGGPSGHSMFGGSDEAFDEAKSGLASKFAKARRDAAASAAPRSIASSYSATGQVNGKYAEPVVAELASLIVGEPVIGNAEKAGIVPAKEQISSEANKSSSFGAVKRGETKNKEIADSIFLSSKEEKGVIAESKDTRDLMTYDLRGGIPFYGKFTDCNANEKCEPQKNAWVFPNQIDIKKPALSFYQENMESLSGDNSQNVYDEIIKSDVQYQTTIPKIAENKPKIGRISYLMIDGTENGAIKLVSPNSYHYQVFKGLIGNADDVSQGGKIDPKKINPNKTIFVVPDKETANNLQKAGFNVVEFEKYAVTPKRLTDFYGDTLKVVQNMASAPTKKLTASEEAMRKQVVAELSGGNKKKAK
jgi:hypothetical protein